MNRSPVSAVAMVGVLSAMALVIAVLTSAPLVVRVPLGLAVAIVMPGILGFRALRGRLPDTLTDVAVSLVASVGVLALLGVVLNLLPAGLTATSWSIALLCIALVLGGVGDYRRHTGSTANVARPRRAKGRSWMPRRVSVPQALMVLACAGLLCAGAVVTLDSRRTNLEKQHLTEMWLSHDNGQPVVHVRNQEGLDVDYRIVVSVAGSQETEKTVRLSNGAEWSTTIPTPRGVESPSATPFPLSVRLYRGDEKAVYRQVRITQAPA